MTKLTRRRFVRAAGGGAITMAAPALTADPVSAAVDRRTGFFRYTIGDLKCTSLYDGIWRKPHDPEFIRDVPIERTRSALRAGGLPTAYVTIEFSQTLIETGGRTVIIDPGTGGQWVDTAGTMPRSLAAAGYAASDIDVVLISHFHPDHIFGLMDAETDAQQYPDAEILVPETEYAFWTDPGVATRLPEAWRPLADRIQRTFPRWPNVRRIDWDVDVAPGIRSLAAPGHTPGHTAYHVGSGGDEMIVAGDAAITPALFVANPDWQVVYDADPVLAQATRRRLFDRISTDDIAVAGYHFGFPNVGRMRVDGSGYAFEPFGM